MTFLDSWAAKNPAQRAAIANSALSHINCSKFTYDPWLGVVSAFKDAGGTFEDYCTWCNRYEGGVPQDVTPQKWQHLPSNPEQFSYLWTTAKEFGWGGSGIKTGRFEKPLLTIEEEKKRAAAEEERKRIHAANRQKVFATIREAQGNAKEAIEYLVNRGISEEVCEDAKIGTMWKNGHPYCLIPYGEQHAFYNARNMDVENDARGSAKCDKPSNDFGDGQILYHAERLTEAGPQDVVFFMEGEIDALSCETAGFAACSGTPNDLKDVLKESGTKAAAVVVVADNDEHGADASAKAMEVLHAAGVHAVKVTPPDGFKDSNQFLQKDSERFRKWIARAADDAAADAEHAASERCQEYCRTLQAASLMGDFDEHFAKRGGAISTGFKNLDDILDGGLYNELYIIGAVSSLGKTALTMQIADNIAAAGRDVLIVSLEMGRYELMARSISRCSTIIAPKYLWQTQRAIERGGRDDDGQVNPNVETVIRAAKEMYVEQYAKHIYITEGGNFNAWDVCEAMNKHIAATGNKPVLIVDYLQILENLKGREHDTDKQKVDTAIKMLKGLVNAQGVPVIAISSFNRENYNEKLNQKAFKESGGIEYTGGVLLGMQLSVYRGKINGSTGEPDEKSNPSDDDKAAALSAAVRMIDVKVLKQRAGRIGQYCTFDFQGAYSRFDEHVEGHRYSL